MSRTKRKKGRVYANLANDLSEQHSDGRGGERGGPGPSEVRRLNHPRPENDPFRYRPDVDGLRAVAVLAVILFHMDSSWVPGGFVGVDMFFVISGFVVTGSLLRNSNADTASDFLTNFYARRFKRLTPALCVVVSSTVFFLSVCVSPDHADVKEYFTSCAWGMLGGANIYFSMLERRGAPSESGAEEEVQ